MYRKVVERKTWTWKDFFIDFFAICGNKVIFATEKVDLFDLDITTLYFTDCYISVFQNTKYFYMVKIEIKNKLVKNGNFGQKSKF